MEPVLDSTEACAVIVDLVTDASFSAIVTELEVPPANGTLSTLGVRVTVEPDVGDT